MQEGEQLVGESSGMAQERRWKTVGNVIISYLECNILKMTRVIALWSFTGTSIQLPKWCCTTSPMTRHFAWLFPQQTQGDWLSKPMADILQDILGDPKVYGMLTKQYWWPQMCKDIAKWWKSCLSCATWHVGRAVKPLCTLIPVGGLVNRIRVDVVQLPVTNKGNKYAMVFMDHLTTWPKVFPTKDQTALSISKLLVKELSAAMVSQLNYCSIGDPALCLTSCRKSISLWEYTKRTLQYTIHKQTH